MAKARVYDRLLAVQAGSELEKNSMSPNTSPSFAVPSTNSLDSGPPSENCTSPDMIM